MFTKTILFLFWSCNSGSPEPDSKIVVVQQTKHSAPADGDFEKHAFKCCSAPEVTELLSSYLSLQEAMAADDEPATLKAGGAFHRRVEELQSQHPQLEPLTQYTSAWGVDSLKEVRMDFESFNNGFLPFIKTFKSETGTLTVSKAFCPMAPGRWVQKNPKLRNPYYGAEMLTCGVFEE